MDDFGRVEENLKTVIIIYQFGDTSGSENSTFTFKNKPEKKI